ncbi:MAG: 50S ribosomal protein L11 methyltransferase [Deltaproteobacteria bacterium]|nr:50S ribosomal protein L11 methyltransferase [Deltaproteobacteria bacterium]
MTAESHDLERLTRILRKTLPEARIQVCALDLCPAVRLHLVSPDNMDRAFSPDETRTILKNTPYWAFCWAAGHALAAFLLENPGLCRGMRVVDVGAGSGVAAVAAAMAGAREVVACDLDGDALEAIRANARLNRVEVEVCGSLEEIQVPVDLVLASDLLYDRGNRPLLEAFTRLATRVLVADSRVRIDEASGYSRIHAMEADTLPDLGEAEAFRRVGFYSPCSEL